MYTKTYEIIVEKIPKYQCIIYNKGTDEDKVYKSYYEVKNNE